MAVKEKQNATVSEVVTESLAGLNVSVDREHGIIRGVKLIGFESKNRRYYPPDVLKAAVAKYEGAKVNVDHPPVNDPAKPRGVADRIGVIKSARFVEGSGIHGDFHFNPKHSLAEQIAWDAEHNPSAIGFSHNSLVQMGKRENGRSHVAEVTAVKSVDLVADPATTNGVFESQGFSEQEQEDDAMDFSKLTLEQIKSSRPDLVKALENEQSGASELQKVQDDLKAAQAKIVEFEKKDAEAVKTAAIDKQLESVGFDPTNKHADVRRHISQAFRKVLNACEGEQDRQELIDDRLKVVGEWKEPAKGAAVQKPVTTPATEGTQNLSGGEWRKRVLGL